MATPHRDLLGGPDPVLLPADPEVERELAEANMADRVVQACEDLLSAGQSQAG